jgi:uncharacterized protein YecE (DUF72 family)
MKSESPPNLVFAVLLPKQISSLENEATQADVTGTVETAKSLGARFIVVRTPPTARPGARTRARLTHLVELLKAAETGIVWEPSGLLAEAEAEAFAETLGVTLARDPARDDLPEAAVAYGRISSLGAGGRIRGSAIEKAADRLAAFDEAYVVLEGENALRAAKDLRGLLGVSLGASAGTDEDDDLDDEEEEEDEDEDEDDLEDEDEES